MYRFRSIVIGILPLKRCFGVSAETVTFGQNIDFRPKQRLSGIGVLQRNSSCRSVAVNTATLPVMGSKKKMLTSSIVSPYAPEYHGDYGDDNSMPIVMDIMGVSVIIGVSVILGVSVIIAI